MHTDSIAITQISLYGFQNDAFILQFLQSVVAILMQSK